MGEHASHARLIDGCSRSNIIMSNATLTAVSCLPLLLLLLLLLHDTNSCWRATAGWPSRSGCSTSSSWSAR